MNAKSWFTAEQTAPQLKLVKDTVYLWCVRKGLPAYWHFIGSFRRRNGQIPAQ